jgi:hypothetical protein
MIQQSNKQRPDTEAIQRLVSPPDSGEVPVITPRMRDVSRIINRTLLDDTCSVEKALACAKRLILREALEDEALRGVLTRVRQLIRRSGLGSTDVRPERTPENLKELHAYFCDNPSVEELMRVMVDYYADRSYELADEVLNHLSKLRADKVSIAERLGVLAGCEASSEGKLRKRLLKRMRLLGISTEPVDRKKPHIVTQRSLAVSPDTDQMKVRRQRAKRTSGNYAHPLLHSHDLLRGFTGSEEVISLGGNEE